MRIPCTWCGGSGRRITRQPGLRGVRLVCRPCQGKGWSEEGVFIDQPHSPRHYDGIVAPSLDQQEQGRVPEAPDAALFDDPAQEDTDDQD